jgi:hypothetical protein
MLGLGKAMIDVVASASHFKGRGPEWLVELGPNFRLLKIYLNSKPANESISSNPAHIGIVLKHRLEHEWSVAQQYVEFDAVLGLPGSHAGREEVWAQTVSHIAQRHGVVKTQRQRLVEAQPRRELHEVAIYIRRTPVERKRRIQAPCYFRVNAPESLLAFPDRR